MEPIKIQIEVNLGEATLELLKALQPLQNAPTVAPAPQPSPVSAKPQTQAKKTTPAPVAEDDDLPPVDAPAPAPAAVTPTEDDARQAVKAARGRGVPAKTIKDLMLNSFNISTSVECPAEKRQELIDALNKLAA